MCRKVLSIFLMALFMLVSAELYTADTAFAQDVWAYSNGNENVYIMTETIINSPEDVTVTVKEVRENVVRYTGKILFNRVNMHWMAQTGSGFKDVGSISSSAYASAIWRTVQPYLRKW